MLKRSEAIFAVRDVPEAIAFYKGKLGFQKSWLWEGNTDFGGASWGDVHVMFNRLPGVAAHVTGHQHFFRTDDVNALHARHTAAGAPIIEPIESKPWGMREYTVLDPNGYHLRFAGEIGYERPATATELLPDHIAIEIRTATLDEYVALTLAVGWNQDRATMPTALERSLFCAMAIDRRDGQAVGMTRVCGDGRYFTIWDVMVLPAYQGQKIGSAMLEASMNRLRAIGPKGAFVGLFTGKGRFYERFGFRDGGGMMAAL